jgi:hypothetical protein
MFVPVTVFGASFSDLPSTHWAYAAVAAASERGVVNGYPDGTFAPAGVVTYGEFIKMAYIAQGGEAREAADADWALPYYEAASEAGLFAKHEIAETRLSAPIPREHMALMLSNILGNVKVSNYDAVREKIVDVEPDTPHEYDIVKVTAYGLITGYPDKTFRPAGTLTRAEAATVICRLIDKSARQLPDLRPPEEKTPLERLLDVPEDSLMPLKDVVRESNSKKPISDVVDESVSWIDTSILYYEIFEDFPYRMKIVYGATGKEAIEVGYQGMDGFLIKDRKVIAEIHSGTLNGEGVVFLYGDDKTFPDFDYLAIPASNSNIMLLIPNNL